MDSNRVLLDSDFCNMLTEIDSEKINSRKLLENLLSVTGKQACIHEYLVTQELFNNVIIQEFITKGTIKELSFTEITNQNVDKPLYEATFDQYFKTMNEEEFTSVSSGFDCFTFRKSDYNLGEIHSIIAARFLNIPLFYTNDGGAKFLAKQYNSNDSKVELISGLDLMIQYKDTNLFDRNTRRAIFTKYEKAHWKEKYSEAVGNESV